MKQLDVYYRALLQYRALTLQNRDCTMQRKAFAQANTSADRMTITRMICTVEEEWLDEIEKGLIFIEKAIKEERQFIYSNGEVEPIEKVKSISTESVKHLAKHSNLITREQQGDEIIPDKLYNVERLNDYAVYENRFLYLLLCYLRDFVTIRYKKILDLSNRYDAELTFNKQFASFGQKVTYQVSLHDERQDDPYLREHNQAKDAIERMDLILKAVMALLATPLMESAAKAPMLKPPVTKTNVLKMDYNFKNTVALYDYIVAYDRPGYQVENKTVNLAPFDATLADELSEAGTLLSFLTYEYGLGLNEQLKSNFDDEEHRRRQKEVEQRQKQLELIRQKVKKSELPPEEYILELEKQIKLLHGDVARMGDMRRELRQLKEEKEQLQQQVEDLTCKNEQLVQEMHEAEVRHRQEIEDLKKEYDERIYELMVKHDAEKREMEKAYGERIGALKGQMREQAEQHRQQIAEAQKQVQEHEAKCKEYALAKEKAEGELALRDARIRALLVASGAEENSSYTEKEEFDELEREFHVFARFYQQQWSKTKKTIRSKFINLYYLRGEHGQSDQP